MNAYVLLIVSFCNIGSNHHCENRIVVNGKSAVAFTLRACRSTAEVAAIGYKLEHFLDDAVTVESWRCVLVDRMLSDA